MVRKSRASKSRAATAGLLVEPAGHDVCREVAQDEPRQRSFRTRPPVRGPRWSAGHDIEELLGVEPVEAFRDMPENRAAARRIRRTGLERTSLTPPRAVAAACCIEERPSRGEGPEVTLRHREDERQAERDGQDAANDERQVQRDETGARPRVFR